MKISDGVFTYRGRSGKNIRRGSGSANVTVVKGDSIAFIDTGVSAGGAFADLIAEIESDSIDMSNINWILFTHCHWDHINAADKLISSNKINIAAGNLDIPYIEDREKYINDFTSSHFGPFEKEIFPHPRLLTKLMIWFVFGSQPKNLIVNRRLENGNIIDIGRKIEAISLPGHTEGHMGYLIQDSGILVTGDLFDFENAFGMDINNHFSNYEAALASLEKVRQIDPEIIIPGHGEPTTSKSASRSLIERALASGLLYPDIIKTALKGSPLPLAKLSQKAFPNIPLSMSSMTMMLVLSVLMHMESHGIVSRNSFGKKNIWNLSNLQGFSHM
ncbi:MAG: MBL fold metallo-hydrolase [Desulfobacterales bacterium]|nr:MBL fold metallo-hydrolase [Desulfobacterales bacterium]MBF0398258.1 MBL fold metallo-hydrolase [Desulfobacterales bacterium]